MTVSAYIAHKDGYWGGVYRTGVCEGKTERRELAKFLSSFARDGFDVMPVASREEYLATLKKMEPWFDRPDAKRALSEMRKAG